MINDGKEFNILYLHDGTARKIINYNCLILQYSEKYFNR